MLLRSLSLAGFLFALLSTSAYAIQPQSTLSVGAESEQKIMGGTTRLFVKGQMAAELLRVLHLDLAVTVTRPHSIFWFEGKAGADLYPLALFVPKSLGFLPFFGAGLITRNSVRGTVIGAGLDFVSNQRKGLTVGVSQATISGIKYNRLEVGLLWR